MRGVALGLCLLTLMIEPASACHRFRIWLYPWPQRCGVASPHVLANRAPRSPAQAFPLPDLADVVWGDCPEEMRGRLMLRAALSPM